MSTSSGERPLTPRHLDLVVPSGWSLEPEPESDILIDDIMEVFIPDVNGDQRLPFLSRHKGTLCGAFAFGMNGERKETAGQRSKFQAMLFLCRPLRCNNGRVGLFSRSEKRTEQNILQRHSTTLYAKSCILFAKTESQKLTFSRTGTTLNSKATLDVEMKRLMLK